MLAETNNISHLLYIEGVSSESKKCAYNLQQVRRPLI